MGRIIDWYFLSTIHLSVCRKSSFTYRTIFYLRLQFNRLFDLCFAFCNNFIPTIFIKNGYWCFKWNEEQDCLLPMVHDLIVCDRISRTCVGCNKTSMLTSLSFPTRYSLRTWFYTQEESTIYLHSLRLCAADRFELVPIHIYYEVQRFG